MTREEKTEVKQRKTIFFCLSGQMVFTFQAKEREKERKKRELRQNSLNDDIKFIKVRL